MARLSRSPGVRASGFIANIQCLSFDVFLQCTMFQRKSIPRDRWLRYVLLSGLTLSVSAVSAIAFAVFNRSPPPPPTDEIVLPEPVRAVVIDADTQAITLEAITPEPPEEGQ